MTLPTITCEHCESEIDVAKDPRCVMYDPSGATYVICADCRKQHYARASEWPSILKAHRIKRGWRA